jgi:pilus assembly protein CpaB
MNRRPQIIALVAAALAVSLLLLYMRHFEREMSGGEKVSLLVAQKAINRGALVTETLVSTRDVPIAYVEDRAIRASELPKIVGVRVANTVQAQEVLMWTDLAVANEDRDLSSLVQPGNRAVTVRAVNSDDTKGNALIRPGDYVDVLTTMPDPARNGRASVVLLQRVLVLAVGLDTESPSGSVNSAPQQNHGASQRDLVLTLSLNLPEAQLLSLALERGHLSVAVRNPDDQRVIEGIPDMPSQALIDGRIRESVQKIRRTGGVAAPPIPPVASAAPMRIEGTGRAR